MDALDYMESETERTFASLTAEYAASHERLYKAATALVAAGGAVGSYVLAQIAERADVAAWAPLGASAVWWFLIAAGLLLFGLRSNNLSSGPWPSALATVYEAKGGDFGDGSAPQNVAALTELRMAELKTRGIRIGEYEDANGRRAIALNWAYRAAAASPLIALAAFWWFSC
ncbi:MAG: hypothetical protein QM777_08790 [Pseudorhodoferax sp.]